MPRPRRRNPWTSTGEVLIWVLFAALLFPAGFAGWAIGHYTSLGKPPATVVHTVTAGTTPGTTPGTTTAPGTTPATTTAVGTTPAGGGNVAAGKVVFASSGCASCHTFKPANATGTIGPSLDTQPAIDAKKTNLTIDAFIKRCITNPSAYIPSGYTAGIMPSTFGKSLSATQLDNLVAFIVAGTAKS